MRIRYWSSDVCSSDLGTDGDLVLRRHVTLHRVVGMTDEIAVEHDAGFHRMCDDAIVGKASRQLACEQHIGELGARVRTAGREVARALQVIPRSEEHTSELQSLMRISYAVFCLK